MTSCVTKELLTELLKSSDRTITQESWIASLIHAWRHHRTLAVALASAAGYFANEIIAESDWFRMQRETEKLYPPLHEHTHLKQQVSVWIATHCVRTNDCLWDGKYEKAIAVLRSKKDFGRPRARTKVKKEITELDKDQRGLLTIKVRERDNRTGWKVTK